MAITSDRRFTADKITDGKRLARGEHFLLARSLLRARDAVHNKRWKILTLAGAAPRGEITALRELMPKSWIVAIDRDAACLDAAIDAGADDVVPCDLSDFELAGELHKTRKPARAISEIGEFDLINLDFCGGINADTRDVARVYFRSTPARSVLVLTFSYGRDVCEVFEEEIIRWEELATGRRGPRDNRSTRTENAARNLERLKAAGVPRTVLGRLLFVASPSMLDDLLSVIVYRGAAMPMVSALFQVSSKRGGAPLSFVALEPGDLELAAVYPDAAALYDYPQDRIASLRRRFAAIKAGITRTARSAAPGEALADALELENARVEGIRNATRVAQLSPEFGERMIRERVELADAQRLVFEELKARAGATVDGRPPMFISCNGGKS